MGTTKFTALYKRPKSFRIKPVKNVEAQEKKGAAVGSIHFVIIAIKIGAKFAERDGKKTSKNRLYNNLTIRGYDEESCKSSI